MRIAAGVALVGVGVLTVIFGANHALTYAWAIAFVAAAAAEFAWGSWDLTIAGSLSSEA